MSKLKNLLFDRLTDSNFFKTIKNLESPSYIYNLEIIDVIINLIKEILNKNNNIKLYFAVKANRNPEILNFMKTRIDGFDVASIHEVELLESLSISNYNINGPAFTYKNINEFYKKGKILDFNSLSQLESSLDIISNKKIGIRVNIPYIEDDLVKESRFGMDILDKKVLKFIRNNNLKITNLHFHSGKKNKVFFDELKDILNNIDLSILDKNLCLNLGGGIDDSLFTDSMEDLLTEIENLNIICKCKCINPTFILEPGSALVNLCGYMISSVLSSDYNYKNENLRVVLDTSAYNLHPWYKPRIITSTNNDSNNINTDIFGLTCYEEDVFFRNLLFRKLEIGDRLILNPVGAYSSSNYSNLHGIPFPNEYFYYKNEIWK
ncbi:MAG: hypothetical protein ACRCXT_08915 [Paraclostridium sp.]